MKPKTRAKKATPSVEPAAAYAALVRRFASVPGVTPPAEKRGKFGSNALKVDGKIFAMVTQGTLAVKLPRDEVEAATVAGKGGPLLMGPGRVMKEWLLVTEPPARWLRTPLAERARGFVAGEGGASPRRKP